MRPESNIDCLKKKGAENRKLEDVLNDLAGLQSPKDYFERMSPVISITN